MASKPEISIPAAIAVGTIVYTIQGRHLAPGVDLRSQAAGDELAETARKQSSWLAAATVGGISLIARDPVIFIVGGLFVIGLDWMARANIWADPTTNKIDPSAANPAAGAPPAETMVAPSALGYDMAAAVN